MTVVVTREFNVLAALAGHLDRLRAIAAGTLGTTWTDEQERAWRREMIQIVQLMPWLLDLHAVLKAHHEQTTLELIEALDVIERQTDG